MIEVAAKLVAPHAGPGATAGLFAQRCLVTL
jgi:hypothetical protein